MESVVGNVLVSDGRVRMPNIPGFNQIHAMLRVFISFFVRLLIRKLPGAASYFMAEWSDERSFSLFQVVKHWLRPNCERRWKRWQCLRLLPL